MTWTENCPTPLSFPAASYLYLCCARSGVVALHIGIGTSHSCTNLAPITTAAGRAASLISVPAPFLLKGSYSKWKRKPRFKVRRGDLSLYARVLCRLALGLGFVSTCQWRLDASSLSKKSRSTGALSRSLAEKIPEHVYRSKSGFPTSDTV